MTESRPHTLFSFGTLLDERVQTALFGCPVPSSAASLAGHIAYNETNTLVLKLAHIHI
ncbi:hypothetical protein [Streptomyces violascens]|uniref:hypothetical protein n=1 Tax=Streptomyces violascens TaxID=67381 RepID=UPI00367C8E5C